MCTHQSDGEGQDVDGNEDAMPQEKLLGLVLQRILLDALDGVLHFPVPLSKAKPHCCVRRKQLFCYVILIILFISVPKQT